jgi:hypothetical protein
MPPMRLIFSALLLCSLLAGCGSATDADDDSDYGNDIATLDTFPVTLEGDLSFGVSEGDNEFGDYADANFGDLVVDGKTYIVYASGPVAQAGGVPYEGGKARVTISGPSEFADTYNISRIEKR